jgi:Glu-tRNA(Gln) amidotransferase subunit E-like FAD-binding protein
VAEIKKHVEATETTLIIVWASDDIQTAVNEIIIRQKKSDWIPSETRQAFSDGTNGLKEFFWR